MPHITVMMLPGRDVLIKEPGLEEKFVSVSIEDVKLKDREVSMQSIPADTVNIPAHTVHWYSAALKSRFTHIGIRPKAGENTTEWGML